MKNYSYTYKWQLKMNNLRKVVCTNAFLFLCIIYSCKSYALECSYGNGTKARSNTATLNQIIYAGDDIPTGTVLYTTTVSSGSGTSTGVVVVCGYGGSSSTQLVTETTVTNLPYGASFNAPEYTNGNIFKTNVDGVGVALQRSETGDTITENTPGYGTYTAYREGGAITITGGAFRVAFIKTGPIAPGSVIDGASIPSVRSIFPADRNKPHTGFPLTIGTYSFKGQITVQSSTCEPISKNVEIGDFNRTSFPGVGSTTPWVDSSIELVNCPSFFGYYGHSGAQSLSGTGTPGGGTLTDNKLMVTLTPNAGIVDTMNGIMKIDESSNNSARGISIQIGYGSPDNSVPWDFSLQHAYTPGNGAGKNIILPMSVRYYRTGEALVFGRADGRLTYTINYY